MRWMAVMLLVAGWTGTAWAAEVLLNDGSAVEGEIRTVDHHGITVETEGETVTIEPLNLDAHYYYTEWAKRVPKDAEAHLRLAVYAFENGMFNQARSQYRKAQRLDAALVEKFEKEVVPKIKEGIAENLLALARQAIQRKDYDQAKRLAAKILTQLEDTKAAEEAREKLASVHLWQLDADEMRFTKTLAKYLPKDDEKALKAQAEVVKKLEPIESRMKKARDLVTKGLRTKSANRQKGIFQQAAKRFERIIQDLDALAEQAGDDEALKAYVAEERAVGAREAVDAYVHAGNVYLVRRSYQEATNMANAALAVDPTSAPAKQFQQQVIRGSQMRSGWWGRGSRGR